MHAQIAVLTIGLLFAPGRADKPATADQLVEQAAAAYAKGAREFPVALAHRAIAIDPSNPKPYFFRGTLFEAMNNHARAVADFDACLKLDPKHADAYNHRGSEQFKLGNIKESLADFDQFLTLQPGEKNGHWKRGISLYYAGRFEDGKKQFEGYENVDTNDVENAVWHFLCNARLSGVEKARGQILKIGKDKRVPMRQVYDLYRGECKPEDVLAAATADNPEGDREKQQLFYAHLYLGIYADVQGDKKKALEHMTLAAGKYRIGHYMGDVARVHEQILARELKNK
jgi:lipoprotein NlpI